MHLSFAAKQTSYTLNLVYSFAYLIEALEPTYFVYLTTVLTTLM